MTEVQAELTAELDVGPELDPDEVAELTQRLRAELLELDIDGVDRAPTDAVPEGARGAELLAAGSLVVHFVLRADVLRSIVGGISLWLQRQGTRSVKLTLDDDTLEVSSISSSEQDRLIELWVSRHSTPAK